ncbi:MAG: hypothetical protein JXX14_10135 [Deltaproteobacteria bacterium]|nr:hypothetical protein [Deltaproteobacteria bacterium]
MQKNRRMMGRIPMALWTLAIWVLCTGCHSAPPPAPPTPPPVAPPAAEEEAIPEVVGYEQDLLGENFAGCGHFEQAADNIWSYRIQANLNLSVQVYEGKIDAADAETLVNVLGEFSDGWKARFKALCMHNEKQFLAPGQYEEGARCLTDLLGRQKDYVNVMFYKAQFDTDEAKVIGTHLTDCDAVLEPRGEKALKDNPF